VLTHCYLLHLQHCSCFRDVVIDHIIGLHCIEVISYDCCHQMSDFKAKRHQIRFRCFVENLFKKQSAKFLQNRPSFMKLMVKHIWVCFYPSQCSVLPSPTVRQGIVILPQDPNALVEMLSERMASFKVGNSWVKNEIVSVGDDPLRQRILKCK